jgi:hypothetical protein
VTPDEREKMAILVFRIQEEKDPVIFDQLVNELNALIERKHERIHPSHSRRSGEIFSKAKDFDRSLDS